MTGVAIVLIAVVVVAIFVIDTALDEHPGASKELQRLNDHYESETARQDLELSNFLTELHQENRAAYRRIKEAARNPKE